MTLKDKNYLREKPETAAHNAEAAKKVEGKLSKNFNKATETLTPAEKLDYAVRHKKMNEVLVLFAAGIIPHQDTLLEAVRNKMTQWVGTFINIGVKPTQYMADVAVQQNDMKTLNHLLDAGVVPSPAALAYAVKKKKTDLVKLLMAKGVRANPEMLFTTMYNNDLATAKALLEKGMVPNESALTHAVWRKKTEWVKLYLEAGAKSTQALIDKATAMKDTVSAELLTAALARQVEAEKNKPAPAPVEPTPVEPAKEEPKLTAKEWAQFTEALHEAVQKNDTTAAEALFEKNITPAEKTLDWAVEKKKSVWLGKLLKAGGQPTAGMLYTALAVKHDTVIANLLLDANVIPDQKTRDFVAADRRWIKIGERFPAETAAETPAAVENTLKLRKTTAPKLHRYSR